MSHLPVIIGFGGINAAGRASFHHAYQRMVIDSIGEQPRLETIQGLSTLMQLAGHNGSQFLVGDKAVSDTELESSLGKAVLGGTLIRRIEENFFPVEETYWQKSMAVNPVEDQPVVFEVKSRDLPEPVPANWKVTTLDSGQLRVEIRSPAEFKVPTTRIFPVQSGGILPSGFDPGSLYPSRNHPRGLQMTIYAASDALMSMGIDWADISSGLAPDQVAVYAGSAMSQLDYNGSGGMLQARLLGKKVSSKQCALGFCEMPADFVNAYILGSVGSTGTGAGACATFLYNLRMAVDDIRSGRRKLVLVGTSEAPVNSEVADGYAAMGALASDADLMKLDGTEVADHRRASRPFGENCGFTLAESAQFLVLCDDELAMERGANIHGAVGNVFVNADGHKKSISAPGAGNYITMAKALGSARALVGDESVSRRSFVQAHGSSTPQNRVTESHILNEAAKAFGMERWPVAAVKSYVGHSIGSAGGDQVSCTLGVWQHGVIPGIKTIDGPASDIHDSNLKVSNQDMEAGATGIDVALINAKGFGGNNATATLLAPHIVKTMLGKKHGKQSVKGWEKKNESVQEQAQAYNQAAIEGRSKPIYRFDHNVINSHEIEIDKEKVCIPGFDHPVTIPSDPDYPDMV
jgi:acetoacetyl-[acyl-carrier protein] synthase